MQRMIVQATRGVVAAVAVGACFAAAQAAEAPELAKRYCARCHEVTPGVPPRNPTAKAPSFLVIANDPQLGTTNNLAHLLSQNHASMPPFSLTAAERQGLIKYIQSFKTQH